MTIAIIALTLIVVLTAALIAADFLTDTHRLDTLPREDH